MNPTRYARCGRRDLRMRLLLLFSDRGLSASSEGAVRDLGALLPALAAACAQEPHYGGHRLVSTEELPELGDETANLVKVFYIFRDTCTYTYMCEYMCVYMCVYMSTYICIPNPYWLNTRTCGQAEASRI